MRRRDLLKAAGLAAVAGGWSRSGSRAEAAATSPATDVPVVASTWNFGETANAEAERVLARGGSALDAVERGVRVVEADAEVTTVGYGGIPNRLGVVQLDAAIIDGTTGEAGAVAALEGFMHPVSVARRVMEGTDHVMLVGDGARRFALTSGFEEQNLVTPAALEEWQKRMAGEVRKAADDHDTIGMVVRESGGRMAAACTTSGMALKLPGRVGDSPIIGHGLYCDDRAGGAAATGVGEEIIKVCGSYQVVEFMRQGLPPGEAIRRVLGRILRRHPQASERDKTAAFVAVRADGEVGYGSIGQGFQAAVSRGSARTLVDVPDVRAARR